MERQRTIVNGGGGNGKSSCPTNPSLWMTLFADADVKSPVEGNIYTTGNKSDFIMFQKKQLGRKTKDIKADRTAAKKFFYKLLGLPEPTEAEENGAHDVAGPIDTSDAAGVSITPFVFNPELGLRPVSTSSADEPDACDKVLEGGYFARVTGDGLAFPNDSMMVYGDMVIRFRTASYVLHFETALPGKDGEDGQVTADLVEVYHPRFGVGWSRNWSRESKNAEGSDLDKHLTMTSVITFPGVINAKEGVQRTFKQILEEHVDYTVRTVIAVYEQDKPNTDKGVGVLQANAREWAESYKKLLNTKEDFYDLLWEHTLAAYNLAVAMQTRDDKKNQENVKILFENLEKVVAFHTALGFDQATIRSGWTAHLQTTVAYYNSLWASGADANQFRADALAAVKHGQQVGSLFDSVLAARGDS